MGQSSVTFTPLSPIRHPQGDLFPGLKSTDPSFLGFGEAYFSTVNTNQIKAWRRHRQMTLNLLVPVGSVKIVVWDEIHQSTSEFTLSPDNYGRLTVPPLHWYGFYGVGPGANLILNVASIPHDPTEMDREPVETFPYDWTMNGH